MANKLSFRSKRIYVLVLFLLAGIIIFAFFRSGYLKALQPDTSLLPLSETPIDSLTSTTGQLTIKRPWYILEVDSKGRIAIKTAQGKVILSSLQYYQEIKGAKGYWGLKNIHTASLNDSVISIKGESGGKSLLEINFICHNDLPKIDVFIKTHYNQNTTLERESIVASFAVPVSEVYLKNRKVDKKNFEDEYWLGKEGARFGTNERSALIYHTPSVSSLQLEPSKNLLFVNLDYKLDHPFVHVPYQPDGAGRWIDISESNFKSGSDVFNNFSLNIGAFPKITPRLMLVPDGYKAGYVFTEHADGGTIQTQRAAYFGSEDITQAANATGGFVAHSIPVTKSVFYTSSAGIAGDAIYDKEKVSPLLVFLDQIYATGLYDICLHTPENLNSDERTMEKAERFMKTRYNAVSWIDHGFYPGLYNRECRVCDGLDSTSQYYCGDIWKKYDTKYMWSPGVEMIKNANYVSVTDNLKKGNIYTAYVALLKHSLSPEELKQMSIFKIIKGIKTQHSYGHEENTLEFNSGNAVPTPLFWKSPSRSGQFYSWATDQAKEYEDLSNRTVDLEEQQIRHLIQNQGVFINHGYFVRYWKNNPGILKKVNGKFIINPNFDHILTFIAKMRDQGDLYVTTINNLLNYWIQLQNISFDYLPDGSIDLMNNNNKSIEGLSLIADAKNILVNGRTPSLKHSKNETIFWFDMLPK
jgi:hypothetical protein